MPSVGSFASALAFGVLLAAAQVPKQPAGLTPPAAMPSDLAIRLDLAGRMPTFKNPTSPAAAGSQLLLIDQSGYLYRWSEGTSTELITPKTLPPGVKLIGAEPLLNVAADRAGAKVYVLFISATAPPGVPRQTSPRAPDGWYLLFEYQFDGAALSAARPVTALQVRSEGHTGGGLTVLDDGTVLMALGDNGDSYEDGRDFAQNPANHLAKLVRVNPSTGATSIVGLGVRAAQRLAVYTFDGEPWVTFVDPGGWVAEEVNAVRVNDLIANPSRLNFGWGRHPLDNKAREGTFYINRLGNSAERVAAAEQGLVDPIAEVGRESREPFAISGPAHGAALPGITLIFGELVSGQLYAISGLLSTPRQEVRRLRAVGADASLLAPAMAKGQRRPNPRFFTFPDGSAGLLVERTGEFYRIREAR